MKPKDRRDFLVKIIAAISGLIAAAAALITAIKS